MIPDETYAVTLTADEIEMLLNSISYERAVNRRLTEDYSSDLLTLFRKLSNVIQEV